MSCCVYGHFRLIVVPVHQTVQSSKSVLLLLSAVTSFMNTTDPLLKAAPAPRARAVTPPLPCFTDDASHFLLQKHSDGCVVSHDR